MAAALLVTVEVSARTWTDAKGKFRIEAEFVELKDGKVVLRKPDGKTISVPLGKLSTADQKFVRGLAKPAAPNPPGAGGEWRTAAALSRPSAGHTATLLPNGSVLIAGGGQRDKFDAVPDAEVLDPTTGVWKKTASMKEARRYHTATILPDGRVLVAGGQEPDEKSLTRTLSSVEIYDSDKGQWATTGSLEIGRYDHTATRLSDGKVLVAGGVEEKLGVPTTSAELYDPAKGTWSATGGLSGARFGHTATLLEDGRVLVCGGQSLDYDLTSGMSKLNSRLDSELFDPGTEKWSPAAKMGSARYRHEALLLPVGNVLVIGGGEGAPELFDPKTNAWSPAGKPGHRHLGCSATLLNTGKVLVGGGRGAGFLGLEFSHSEFYDPAANAWSEAPDPNAMRSEHTATLLGDGAVLIVGGFDKDYKPLDSAEIYSSK